VSYEDDPLATQLAFREVNGYPPLLESDELWFESTRRRLHRAHRPLHEDDVEQVRRDLDAWTAV
jgi:hypothetical protein